MVEVVATVVEKITTTTEKSQCFTEVQELSGRSGYNINFSGKIANCFWTNEQKKKIVIMEWQKPPLRPLKWETPYKHWI